MLHLPISSFLDSQSYERIVTTLEGLGKAPLPYSKEHAQAVIQEALASLSLRSSQAVAVEAQFPGKWQLGCLFTLEGPENDYSHLILSNQGTDLPFAFRILQHPPEPTSLGSEGVFPMQKEIISPPLLIGLHFNLQPSPILIQEYALLDKAALAVHTEGTIAVPHYIAIKRPSLDK